MKRRWKSCIESAEDIVLIAKTHADTVLRCPEGETASAEHYGAEDFVRCVLDRGHKGECILSEEDLPKENTNGL